MNRAGGAALDGAGSRRVLWNIGRQLSVRLLRKEVTTMIKIRTAKQSFTDTFGNAVQPGERFALIEVRPVFVSRTALEAAVAELAKEPETTQPASPAAAEGGQ